jgi:Domain of unknown function (DUF5615)
VFGSSPWTLSTKWFLSNFLNDHFVINQRIVLGHRRRKPAVDFRDATRGGVIGIPDSAVLRVAAESGRILISHDRQTMPAHLARFLEGHSSPGVIIVSQDLDIGAFCAFIA